VAAEVQVEAGKKLYKQGAKLSLEEKQKLVEAIHHAELQTTGELRVHFSYRAEEDDIMVKAKAHFASLGMHQTKEHNGMLLYINPDLKKFCVFGDEGIHQKVKQDFWDKLTIDMTHAIREKNMIHGVVHAIQIMGRALKTYYPAHGPHTDQLPYDVSESD
jgi:uncharacterized membrane protein